MTDESQKSADGANQANDTQTAEEGGTKFEFKAQVQRVLSLVINSLYTNREVFLRELVSNASDALEKRRFLSLSQSDKMVETSADLGITIAVDGDAHTITLEDNGIGMNREEVVANLGTIAKSGTGDFLESMAKMAKAKAQKDEAKNAGEDGSSQSDLIGQFGVGFYSAFMVAQRVDVQTLSALKGAEPVLWRSTGEGSYHLLPGDKKEPGTRIVIHLKDDVHEFAEEWRIKQIIKKYSDFVQFPIKIGDEKINKSIALWRQPRSKVTDEEHADFFKHLTRGYHGDKPLMTIHYAVDAPVQFNALLYVPEKATAELFQFQKEQLGLQLYAKRVMITEHCSAVIPVYLRFVKGVVDSEDLTLNVSRETLQDDRTIKKIEQQLTTQVLKKLGKLADSDAEAYDRFFGEFGAVLKEGLSMDFKNKDKIADLCRFETLLTESGKSISLKAYIEALDADGDDRKIYYLTGASREQLETSPHLEAFRKKGIDVLLMSDPIDEWVVKGLSKYDDVELKSVAHGDVDLGDAPERPADEQLELDNAVSAIKKALEEQVADVRISTRLDKTAACLVAQAGDPGANLERIMRVMDQGSEDRKRILEVNGDHGIVKNLRKLVKKDPLSEHVKLYSQMLLDQALLSEGVISDPSSLVDRLQQLLTQASELAVRDTV